MGAYLANPDKDKNPEWGYTGQAWWGACSM